MKMGNYYYLDETITIVGESYLAYNVYFMLFCSNESIYSDLDKHYRQFCEKYGFRMTGGCTYSRPVGKYFYFDIVDEKKCVDELKKSISEWQIRQIAALI